MEDERYGRRSVIGVLLVVVVLGAIVLVGSRCGSPDYDGRATAELTTTQVAGELGSPTKTIRVYRIERAGVTWWRCLGSDVAPRSEPLEGVLTVTSGRLGNGALKLNATAEFAPDSGDTMSFTIDRLSCY